jgi:hypothetical protein
MTPEELVRIYPWLDHLMAETLIKAHENGTLPKYLEEWTDHKLQPTESHVIKGAIEVLPSKILRKEKSPQQVTDGARNDL